MCPGGSLARFRKRAVAGRATGRTCTLSNAARSVPLGVGLALRPNQPLVSLGRDLAEPRDLSAFEARPRSLTVTGLPSVVQVVELPALQSWHRPCVFDGRPGWRGNSCRAS